MTEFKTLEDLTRPNKRLAKLEELITKVDQPGDYFANDLAVVPIPRIEVDSVGVLSFPVPDTQVRELLDAAEQSPFGLGTDTIIDPKVRDCKQFEPEKVRISGKLWEQTFNQILNQATNGLGCPDDSISAEFYKLLVYDTGGFFSPHRDTEKGDGMVATLVISLPVAGTGGEIVIRHQGREKVIDMTTDNPSELSWVAFFADCEHEIRPVTSGHRICLVYNLMVKPGKSIPTPPPDYITMVKPVVQELMSISRDAPKGNKLFWVLNHNYTEAGISFDTLKNEDAAIGALLHESAKMSDYVICTALLEVCDRYDEYDDYYGPSESHIETTAELTEIQAVLKSDVVPNKLNLNPGEMMPSGDHVLGFADEEDYEGPTGNAGAAVDRIYLRAALLFWPRRNTIQIASSAGSWVLLNYFYDLWQKSLEDNRPTEHMHDLANTMLDELLDNKQHAFQYNLHREHKEVLQILVEHVSEEKLPAFITKIIFPYYQRGFNKSLIILAKRISANEMGPDLLEFIADKLSKHINDFVKLAAGIHVELYGGNNSPNTLHSSWENTLRDIVSVIIAFIPSIDTKSANKYWQRTKPLSQNSLVELYSLAINLKMYHEVENLTVAIIKKEDLVAPDSELPILLQELKELKQSDAPIAKVLADLWQHTANFLLSRSERPPPQPTDWKLPTVNKSRRYEECIKLKKFCLSPTATVLHLPAVQEIRDHLEKVIENGNLDIDCHTVTKGRPYTLVCTKNRATFKKQLEQYDKDIKTIQLLLKEARDLPISMETAEALHAAVARAPATGVIT